MDILSIILISMLLFAIVLLIWIEIHYKRKVTILRNENNLHKIVNEYQSEAVVLFSENFELLRANIAARKNCECVGKYIASIPLLIFENVTIFARLK